VREDVVLRLEEHCGFAIMKVVTLISGCSGQTQLHKSHILLTRHRLYGLE
jgi:hypothetical protein